VTPARRLTPTKTHNPQNERIKRAYFTYLTEVKGFSEATLDGVAKALNRFETYTRFRDFKAFRIEQAKAFKAHLADQPSLRSKDQLSKATLYATLSALKRFFIWLAGQPGFKSRISYSDAEYFNLSAKETRIAKAHRDARVPTLEQIQHVIRTMSVLLTCLAIRELRAAMPRPGDALGGGRPGDHRLCRFGQADGPLRDEVG
jgi:site-specific recombinase XerC